MRAVPSIRDRYPAFDEVYVVSDLHIGGVEGFQIFDKAKLFKGFVESLIALPAAKKLALVINGDLVDFLAEPDARCFNPFKAVEMLDRMINKDPNFTPVWEALRTFIKTQNRRLVIILGNHDLELALPWVREYLLEELARGDALARGQVTLALDGSGFRCRVGTASILCLHGNEADEWNFTDYERLRTLGRDHVLDARLPDEWVPNEGARVVVEIMNRVKREYPFVDLLKPDVPTVLETVAILDPTKLGLMRSILASSYRSWRDGSRHLLSAGEDAFEDLESGTADGMSGGAPVGISRRESWDGGWPDTDALLDEVEGHFAAGTKPLDLLAREWDGAVFLGRLKAFAKFVTFQGRQKTLREALAGLRNDRSWNLTEEDGYCKRLDRKVGSDIHYLVVGHSHLEKAMPRKPGQVGSYYYNSGTWARLIGLAGTERPEPGEPRDFLSGDEAFKPAYEAFTASKRDPNADGMKALDAVDGLVVRRPTVVLFWSKGGVTHGELRRAQFDNKNSVTLQPVKGTRFSLPGLAGEKP
jgi:hypothetical protein